MTTDLAHLMGRSPEIFSEAWRVVFEVTEVLEAAYDGNLPDELAKLLAETESTLEGSEDRRTARTSLERLRGELAVRIERAPVEDERTIGEITSWLDEILGMTRRDLTDLLSVGVTRLNRWITGRVATTADTVTTARVRWIARVVQELRHTLTVPGVVEWLRAPNRHLTDRTPLDSLNDPEGFLQVERLAKQLRSQSAA